MTSLADLHPLDVLAAQANGHDLLRPPTSIKGYVEDVLLGGSLVSDPYERVVDVSWPTSVETYSQMRRDAKLAAILDGYKLQLRRAQWQLDGTGCRPEVTALVADDFGLPVKGRDEPGAARTRGVSWNDHLRYALTTLDYGHAGAALQARYDDDGKARLIGLWERPQQTIMSIHVKPKTGEFNGISQELGRTRAPFDKPEIRPEHMVWYAREPEGAGWWGTSLLRPSFAAWLFKREMMRVAATANRRFAMGIPTVEWAPGSTPTPAQFSEAQRAITAARVGDQSGVTMPPGAMMKLVGMSGGTPDTMAFLSWLDQQMSVSVLMPHLDLGQTATGSRALGESFIDSWTLALEAIGEEVADAATRQVAARIVAWNWGADEPVPRVTVAGIGSRREVTAESLQLLLTSGALAADPGLEEWVRREYRLPERTEPRPVPPPGPQRPAPRGGQPAAVQAAAEAFDPYQPRAPRGTPNGGQWVDTMHFATGDERAAFRSRIGKAIPPAWTDVHVADDPDNASLLVVGRDGKGRRQAIYSAAHTEGQAAAKFQRVRELDKHLDKLDHAVERDAAVDDDAAALLLIRRLGMRPGSTRDTRASEQAYGATTLEARHVRIADGRAKLAFTGKKGVDIRLSTGDPLIVDVLSRRLETRSGGDRLFDTDVSRVRYYLHSTGVPRDFLLKDLRTVHANALALREIADRDGAPASRREFQSWRRQVATTVSRALGNTPELALSSYIHPSVFAAWVRDPGWVAAADARDDAVDRAEERRLLTDWFASVAFEPPAIGIPPVEPDPDDEDDDQSERRVEAALLRYEQPQLLDVWAFNPDWKDQPRRQDRGLRDYGGRWVDDPDAGITPDVGITAPTRRGKPATGEAALNAAPVSVADDRERGRAIASEKAALTGYLIGNRYADINGRLRAGGPSEDVADDVRALDSALAKSPLRRDVQVMRGIMDGRKVFGRDAWNVDLTGAEWTEHGFVSTTADPELAESQFTRATRSRRGPAPAVLDIRVPEGTRGVELSEHEQELLLERGLKMRVVSDTGPGSRPRRIGVEVVR